MCKRVSKKEIVAMILAGGQGSRLGVLTKKLAKPAVPYGGKYRIIDFPLSNCSNSGIYSVGVLTQYKPLELNAHIGIGSPWDLDRKDGGVRIFHIKKKRVEIGIRVQQMQYIKILNLLIAKIQTMFLYYQETIYIKWIMIRC